MEKDLSTTKTNEGGGVVDEKLQSLKAVLDHVVRTLPIEKQDEYAALIKAKIEETQREISQILSSSRKNSAEDLEVVDELVYQEKLALLLSYSEPVEFKQLRGLPRDDGNFPWVRTLEYFAPKAKIGKWMKAVFVEGKNSKSGFSMVQSLFLQEWDSYDRHAWEMESGESILPIRIINNQIEAAITVKNPAGAGGKPQFSTPRHSFSNKNKTVFGEMPAIHREHQRADFNRMTGKVSAKIVLVDGENNSLVDQSKEKIVWFNLGELKKLLTDPKMQDSITIGLVRWLLLNVAKVTENISVKR